MYGQLKKVILFSRLEKGQAYHMTELFMTLRLADIALPLKIFRFTNLFNDLYVPVF